MRATDRYKQWVRLIRTGEPENIRTAVESLETRQRQFGLPGGEERMLQRARELLAEGGSGAEP
ncbi:MAG TPA: hypothetical protein VFN75_05945 [Pseudonocardiaceae bacterium]|nr:hypothetical protein [Pseudonocardiaceae bacterium]